MATEPQAEQLLTSVLVELIGFPRDRCADCGKAGLFVVSTLGWRRSYCGGHLLIGLEAIRRQLVQPTPPAAA